MNLARLLLAVVFVFSGTVKIIDPRGTEYKIQDYAAAMHLQSLTPLYVPLLTGSLLALAEFCLGIFLLFGINRRWTSRIVFIAMLVFTPWTLYLALNNPVHDCGCFGDAIVLTNWQTFWKNVVLLVAALIVVFRYRYQRRIISERNQWIVRMYSWVFGFVMIGYNIYNLPIIDFRPYHIGADINAEMQWKENGSVPEIPDLMITDSETGEDVTDSIISSPGWKFLIVSPRLELADDGVMDRLSDISDYCHERNYMMACLTSSDEGAISQWCDMTGADYPFYQVDETPLKTMIRSNPGLILMQGSIVKGKWAASQLPGDEDLTEPLEKLPWVQNQQATMAERLTRLLLWFMIPLIVCTVLDRMWIFRKITILTIKRNKKDEKAHCSR